MSVKLQLHPAPAGDPAARRRGICRDRPAGRLEDARREGEPHRCAVDRPRRARRARVTRAAHASAHLGRPRADRERLPLLRGRAAEPARPASAGVPARPAHERTEVEAALQATTEMLSQVTRLLALVSAPPLEATTVVRVEVLLLQPEFVMVVVITSAGGVTKRIFHFERASRSRPRQVGGRVSERDRRRPAARHGAPSPPVRRCRACRSASATFLAALRPAFTELVSAEQRLYVGGAADLLGEVRAEELDAYRNLFELVEKRAALLDVLGESTYEHAQPVRAGRPGSRSSGAARDRARRRLLRARASRPRRGQPDRPGAHGLREGARRCPLRRVRALALRRVRVRRALASRRHGDNRAGLLRAARRRARRRRGRDQEGLPLARARAASGRLRRADADERFREVVEAYEVLSKSETRELYDRYGHAGLRSGGFEPGHFDFGSLSDLFSAFFGDDLLGRGRARRRSRRDGRDRARRGGAGRRRATCRSRSR